MGRSRDSGVLQLLGVDGMPQACVLQRRLILESPRMHDKNIDCGIPLKIYTRRSEGQLEASDLINVSGVAKQDWERVKERGSGGHLQAPSSCILDLLFHIWQGKREKSKLKHVDTYLHVHVCHSSTCSLPTNHKQGEKAGQRSPLVQQSVCFASMRTYVEMSSTPRSQV